MPPPPYYSGNANVPSSNNDAPPSHSSSCDLAILDATRLATANQGEDAVRRPSQTVATSHNGSVATLNRSTSVSSNGIFAGQSVNNVGHNCEDQGLPREAVDGNGSKPQSLTKLNETGNQQFELRYVSSPVISQSLSSNKNLSGQVQGQLAVSKSTSTLADSDGNSKFNPAPMTRGHGTINLDRCISRSTPGLFDSRTATLAIVGQQFHTRDGVPDTNTAGVEEAGASNQVVHQTTRHGRSHVRLTHDRYNTTRTQPKKKATSTNHRNIPYSSRAIRAHILGQADLAGSHGGLQGGNESDPHQADDMHVGNESATIVLGQGDLAGITHVSNTHQNGNDGNGQPMRLESELEQQSYYC